MVKAKGFLLLIPVLAISCSAFPATGEDTITPVETQAERAEDAYSTDHVRRDVAATGKLDLTIGAKEGAQKDLSPPSNNGNPDDLMPPTREGMSEGALTDEELSELARCGYGGGFGGGFNRPIFIPVPVNQPGIIDVSLSRVNGLNTNNRPAVDWLTLLRLLG